MLLFSTNRDQEALTMMRYTNVWWTVWTILATVIAFVGALGRPSATVAFFIMGTVVGGIVTFFRHVEPEATDTRIHRELAEAVAGSAIVSGIMTAGVLNAVLIAGIGAIFVLLMAGLTFPAFVSFLAGLRSVPAQPAAVQAHDPGPADPVVYTKLLSGVSDAQLCDAWYETLDLLTNRPSAVTPEIVSYRHACLDEMERRYPHAIQTWLAAKPTPDANPARYINDRE